jgi:hypothetical protein
MTDDRLLLAVNELIKFYEEKSKQSLSQENEVVLDIIQVSNLHQADMILHGMELGGSLDVMHHVKNVLNDSEPPELGTNKQELKSGTVKSDEEECGFVQTAEYIYKKANEFDQFKVKKEDIEEYGGSSLLTAGKWTTSKANNYYESARDWYEEATKKDEEDCINCKITFNQGDIFPEYEITWELKQFLKNLRSLLLDISKSLDPTQLIKDFCSWYRLLKENGLCFSNWPIIIAMLPMLISDARIKLTEIGFSWTGIVGPLVAPILGGLTKILETLRALAVPIFNCILNALNISKSTLKAIDRVTTSLANQGLRAADSLGQTFENLYSDGANVNKKPLANAYTDSKSENTKASTSTLDDIKVVPEVESPNQNRKYNFSTRTQSSKTKIELPRLPDFLNGKKRSSTLSAPGERFSVFAQDKGEFAKAKQYQNMQVLIGIVDKLIGITSDSKNYVVEQFNNIIYLLKSINRLIIEPLFISAQLVGQIKVLFNLVRLIGVIIKVISNYDEDICDKFTEENGNTITGLIEEAFNEVELEVSKNEIEASEEATLKLKAKYSDHVARLEPVKCNEVFLNSNKNQFDIDMLYDEITKSLR